MTVIWKYPMPVENFLGDDNSITLSIPEEFQFLTVQVQDGVPTLWVEVDPESPKVEVKIAIVGTGGKVPDPSTLYVGTVQLGGFVWHFYDIEEEPEDDD